MNRQSCRKIAHWTRRMAEKHAESVRKRTGERLYPYVCNRCGHWHIGHDLWRPGIKKEFDMRQRLLESVVPCRTL